MVEAEIGSMIEDEIDFESRELCSDGNCTGVLGDDGVCRVCGRNRGGEPVAQPEAQVDVAQDSGTDEFSDRELCHDGNCTGILGSDGRCKVCGKSS